MINKEVIEIIFQFLYNGYLVPLTFILLIVYFKLRNKINLLRYKFLADICVIAIFIFSIDIMIFPHKYNPVDKSTIYSQDLEFIISNYEKNKSQELVPFNIKDKILEEFKYVNDVKK